MEDVSCGWQIITYWKHCRLNKEMSSLKQTRFDGDTAITFQVGTILFEGTKVFCFSFVFCNL